MSASRRSSVQFATCALLLVACAAFMHVAQAQGYLKVIKAALPIRKPLMDFDRSKLESFEFVNALKLSQETVDELGTKEYINWVLALPDGAVRAVRGCTLSVTYYTGIVDQVPHVPEECMFQGAFTQDSDEVMEMVLPTLGETIEVRRLSFYPPRDQTTKTFVYYTICVNGGFFGRRDIVRFHMADPRDTHLYYSKVEVDIREPAGDRELDVLDEVARDLLDKVISELMRSHWPLRGWEHGGPSKAVDSTAGEPAQTAEKGV